MSGRADPQTAWAEAEAKARRFAQTEAVRAFAEWRGRPPVVALTGPAGSGKSTAAGFLAADHGFKVVKFAGPLKQAFAGLMLSAGLTPAEVADRIEGRLKETPDPILGGRSPRFAMQTLGTEWGRDIMGPGLWVDLWRNAAATATAAGVPVVCDDCRFDNEAAAIRASGGIVIGIERPGLARIAAHPSEAGVVPDLTVANDGTPAGLVARIIGLLKDRRLVG